MAGDKRRRRQLKKVEPGDGSALPPYRWWHPLRRSLFLIPLAGADGPESRYAVDVDFLDWDSRAGLYRDGEQTATAKLPAAFPVPGGVIEVATTTLGLSRMHYVADDGSERQLQPHPRSGEGRRARFDRDFPRASRAIGATAIAVLLVSLALALPQIVEWVTTFAPVAERVGTFESPISLPPWANSTLFFASLAAGIERALNLRSHWLIDAETWWLGD